MPNGPPTGAGDGPAPSATSPHAPPAASAALRDPWITEVFTDDFERATIGPAWRNTADAFHLKAGRMCAVHGRNHGVWLARRLPKNAIVEVTAFADSPSGDLKIEVWGDGASAATSASYGDATSYLAILGGWNNRFHVLARRDEHAPDRLERIVDAGATDPRDRPVQPRRGYRFRVERRDGHTVRWLVDDVEMMTLDDPAPLVGVGHDHVGLNDWDVPVCFDDLKITPLPE